MHPSVPPKGREVLLPKDGKTIIIPMHPSVPPEGKEVLLPRPVGEGRGEGSA